MMTGGGAQRNTTGPARNIAYVVCKRGTAVHRFSHSSTGLEQIFPSQTTGMRGLTWLPHVLQLVAGRNFIAS
eukprot:12398609-Karenia_brevis.AAC.1